MNAQNNLNHEWNETQKVNLVLETEKREFQSRIDELMNLNKSWLLSDRDFSKEILSVINLNPDEKTTMELAKMFWTQHKALNLILKERKEEKTSKTFWNKKFPRKIQWNQVVAKHPKNPYLLNKAA